MTVIQLRAQLHQAIETLDDATVLEQLLRTARRQPETDVLDELTPEQVARLHEALEQVKAGPTYPDQEARMRIRQWLQR